MATGNVVYQKIPLGGDPSAPVTAEHLDRVQQAIVQMAATIQSPVAPNVVTVGSDYTVKGTEDVLHVTSQLSPVKITLLQPSSSNRPLTIKQVDVQGGKTQVNPVTIVTPDGSSTIAGKPSIALDSTGTGSVSISADNSQHWPSTSSGGNPPVAPPGSGTVYVAGPGIIISGNVISAKASGSTVTSVSAIAPLLSSGGTAPVLSLSIDGSLTVTLAGQLSLVPLSGDVVTVSGSNNTTIQPHVVSYGKIQQESAVTLLGNPTGAPANVSEITLGTGLAFSGTTIVNTSPLSGLSATSPIILTGTVLSFRQSGPNTLVGNPTGSTATVTDVPLNAPLFFSGGNLILNYDGTSLALSGGTVLLRAALTGDVAAAAGSNSTTIQPHAVSYGKMQQASAATLIGNPTGGTADLREITLGTNLSFSGNVLNATGGGGGGTVTNVTGTAPIAVATGTTTPVVSLNIDATLAVVSSNLGRSAISGDVAISAGSNTAALINIPNDTTMAGDILAAQSAAPATPTANHGRVWFDSTSKNFLGINEGAVKSAMVQARSAVAHQFLTGVTLGGSWSAAQPDYSDLTGTVPAITALTGDVVASGTGSVAATIQPGVVTYTKIQVVAPSSLLGNPSAGGPATVSGITLGTGLSFSGTTLVNTGTGDHKVLVDGSDTSPAYLSSKLLAASPLTLTIVSSAPPATGLKLWLKADTGVTLSGPSVTAWADQSGLGNNYAQATGGKQPTVTSSAINGLPAVTFDGATQFLTSSFQIGGAKTVVIVRKLVSTPGAATFGEAYTLKDASNNFSEALFMNSGGYQPYSLLHNFTGTTAVGDATALDTAWHVGIDTYNNGTNTLPASYTLTLDSASQTVAASSAFGRASTDLPSLGARATSANAGSAFAAIQIAEVLVYDHVLSGSDMTAVESYLFGRYGIGSGGGGGGESMIAAIQGSIVSGSTSTTAQNLGALTSGILKQTVSGGVSTISVAAAGSDYQGVITWPTASQVLVSAGTAVAPLGDSTFTFDRVAHVMAAGNAVGINGAVPASNVSLVTGLGGNGDRDRVVFFLGGGTLGATGTSDNTLCDINPAFSVAVRTGVTGGIYSTQRIRRASYTGTSSPTITEATTLYIDGAPIVSGLSDSGEFAIHVAGGIVQLDTQLNLPFLAGSTASAIGVSANGVVQRISQPPAYSQQWSMNTYQISVPPTIGNNKQSVITPANAASNNWLWTATAGTAIATTLAANAGTGAVSVYPVGNAYSTPQFKVTFNNCNIGGSGSGTWVFELFAVAGSAWTAGNYTSLGTVSTAITSGTSFPISLSGTLSAIPSSAGIVLAAYRSDSNGSLTTSSPSFTATLQCLY